ncbi:hypothetical protein [Erythrobacter sp.]|uniref:hypothetical protein n=1 Tax=Erythrobacter sp. TaxID=1042 RepID=UPI001B2B2AC9|nr:hypothetical protein [Erythrobacter sp.]MBO6525976.1 hypothetical protein [Erythrobacter sp.]MBO6529349.1 hypothetical protein [Erythrobacter sp.]
MARSVAIVGAGQIAYELVAAFTDDWRITLHSRSKPQWLSEKPCPYERFVRGEDEVPTADCVIDTIAFDESDVAAYDPDNIGTLIAISSASVYCDASGRTLDEATTNGFPDFDAPITETQSTVAAGPDTYSTRKVRMENKAIEIFGNRATLLRPCAIHGAWSRHPREWWFVKRILDGRTRIPLAYCGKSQFQTTSARVIGEAAVAAAERSIGGIFNLVDGDTPTVAEIGQSISQSLGRIADFVLLDGEPLGSAGRTPWSIPRPMAISLARAVKALGSTDLPYAFAVDPAVDWLRNLNLADWRTALPQLAAYPWDLFDYAAEDAILGAL